MRKLVFSIKPKYAEAIYEGRKKWEFRTRLPRSFRRGDEAVIYETLPVGLVTGGFTAGTVYDVRLIGEGSALMTAAGETTRLVAVSDLAREGRVGPADLKAYFKDGGKAVGVAAPERLGSPLLISDLGLTRPPQSWGWAKKGPF